MKIVRILGREIFNSRGYPTVQCQLFLDKGISILASVPTGASTGSFEAIDLRDGGYRLFGKGVTKAIENIEHVIAPQFIGKEPSAVEMDLKMIELDGTIDKSRLGANAMLAVSMAIYRAEAFIEQMELYEFIAFVMGSDSVRLPYPMFNVINGGKHADNNLTIQEFMIIPVGVSNFRASLEAGVIFFQELKNFIRDKNLPTAVEDEGGFGACFSDNNQAFDILLDVAEFVAKKYSISCVFAIDVAASSYFDSHTNLYIWNGKYLDSDAMIEYYQDLISKYPIYAIEDGLSDQDWQGWANMTKALENKVQIVADDLFATNIFRIAQGIEEQSATSAIIKPNQIGTVTEALQAIKLCKEQGVNTIASHRSGETEDTFISDLAVGASCEQIKAGSCCRGERISKYNRLLYIEDRLTFSLFDA